MNAKACSPRRYTATPPAVGYSEWDLEWLDVCIRFRSCGTPLTAIRDDAALARAQGRNERMVRATAVVGSVAKDRDARDLVSI
jgi:hypothetical protein